ncbi:MAG: DUF3108 domain-containing protein, partial [Pseudomonadota bacterium]|nr:DUF3108 domain-containing protein [Pseudomonadota bacterium]
PPTYPARLPPSATLRYEVRRGFLRGSGEMRWQSTDARYTLALEARIGGLPLLTQSSSGDVDAHGLAPERFVDQRLRRAPLAANFHRDSGTITFSGTGQQWPLLPGTQDRLSVLIQLAGIVTAQPEMQAEGGRVVIVVVGARGEAALWTIRFAGFEDVDTIDGPVRAAKWVRMARTVADSSAELWLDPARHHFPVHATFRNSAGAAEYDLLLEKIELGP